MTRNIIAEVYPWESRVAIVEDGRLTEVFWANQDESVGNIYKGRVKDILPGLSCVFIDIGLNKNAFLYAGDIQCSEKHKGDGAFSSLKNGQNIMIQVKKEAFSEKGARVTGNITIPGHYLVLLPFSNDISISRKVTDDARREQLRVLMNRYKPDNLGIIMRTSCLEGSDEEILAELRQIMLLWEDIKYRYLKYKAPSLVFEDMDFFERILRDYLDSEVSKVVTNDERLLAKVTAHINDKNYSHKTNVSFEQGALFEMYNLEKHIRRAIRRKVWMKSGGYLVFDETEAMTVIDVNSGKFTGNKDFSATVFQLNCEAAAEIPRQLRLRSIGGVILIDFINMKDPAQEQEVMKIFRNELEKDKAHTKIIGMTGLGFLEMTRRKSRYGVLDFFSKECHVCNGRGRTLNISAITCEIKRKLAGLDYLETPEIICEVNPHLQKSFTQDEKHFQYLEEHLGKRIKIKYNNELEIASYKIYANDISMRL
ncbi:MAG: Rne/Rng family ribonuclease [Syntrophomonadaceae bacterium]|jgi:ribonuclease G|nr:Rne/Rng family ribonuclease [Syntrophomonadaceae bacterium]